jgi:hypothetical protein
MKDLTVPNLLVGSPYAGLASLVLTIIKYYYSPNKKIDLAVDSESGAVEIAGPVKQDFAEFMSAVETKSADQFVICIPVSDDNSLAVAKMSYHQYFKQWIIENNELATEQWPELINNLSDPALAESAFLSDLFTKVYVGWATMDQTNIDLTIDFETIMGTNNIDLHQTIADFIEVDRLPEIDTFIEQYRSANQQYL